MFAHRPFYPGPCSIVSHPPKSAAGWGSLGRGRTWASPSHLPRRTTYYGQVGLVKKLQTRTKELQDIWKPLGIVSSLVAAIGSVRHYYTRTGPYFLGSAGLLVLALLLLYTVPIASVRLFVRRLVGLRLIFLSVLSSPLVRYRYFLKDTSKRRAQLSRWRSFGRGFRISRFLIGGLKAHQESL